MASGIDRIGALSKAFEFIYKSETDGDYYEFGVFQGMSLGRAIRANTSWKKKTGRNFVHQFFGFDSFEGLPQFTNQDNLDGYGVFQPGQFSDTSDDAVLAKIKQEGLSAANVKLIPGFFSESLSADSTRRILSDSRVAIAHIDCDLYSSATECLAFLDGRLADGAVLLFDDWYCYRGRPDCGVHKAFVEWQSCRPYYVSDYFSYSWAGRAFIVNLKDCD